jgi:hypothetical protein
MHSSGRDEHRASIGGTSRFVRSLRSPDNARVSISERNLGATWVVATVVGWAIGFFVCEALKAFVSTFLVDGLIVGTFIGIAQGLVVRRGIAPLGWWVLVTIAGFGVGLAAGEALALNLSGPVGDVVTGVIIGAAVGIAQWLILRRGLAQAVWWIPANIAAWGLGWTLIRLVDDSATSTLVIYLVGAAGAAVAGIITAIALIALMRRHSLAA